MKLQRRILVLLTAAVMLVLGVSQAVCGPRDHEDGFLLRLATGAAIGASTEIDIATETFKMSGTGVDLEIAIGGVVTPNLAIHGTLLAWVVSDPKLEVADESGNAGGTLGLAGAGAGLTYYIMPVNLYLTGTAGFGRLEIGDSNVSYAFGTGFLFEAAIGKEFFVSDKWGLGLSVGIVYHSVPWDDVELDNNWTGVSVPVRFTATMN